MFQRAFRIARLIGLIGILCAIPIAAVDPAARPNLSGLWLGLLIAAGAGLVSGLLLRVVVPTDKRIQFFLSLSPRFSSGLQKRWASRDRRDDESGRG
jgi:hypothetical protein